VHAAISRRAGIVIMGRRFLSLKSFRSIQGLQDA
jgi:hypothetical protein